MVRAVLIGLALQSALAVGLIAGWWFDDVQGARNVVAFLIWAIFLPVGLMAMCSDAWQRESAAKPPQMAPLLRWTGDALCWALLLTLVWHGWVATAIAQGLFMLSVAVYRQQLQKYRAQLANASPA